MDAIEHLPSGAALLLPNVTWEEYERLQNELGESSDLRIFFDRGKVEIMSILAEHEEYADLLQALIRELTRMLGWKLETRGSATLKRQMRARGAEPDGSCYIQNAERIIGKRRLDLDIDPPPDLVIEIDLTSESVGKFPIHAALGVPEIWRYDSDEVFFYLLENQQYVESLTSRAFPFLASGVLSEFIELNKTDGQDAAIEAFREWARQNIP
jgi:Uma2 family endonuclease